MPDPKNLNSPRSGSRASGLITAEEVWNELGGPVDDNPSARGDTPIETIEAVRNRILRGYEESAKTQIAESPEASRFQRYAEPVTISMQPAPKSDLLAVGDVPGGYVTHFFEVVESDGKPLAFDENITATAAAPMTWDDYLYQPRGEKLYALPRDLGEVSAWLISTGTALTAVLGQNIPEINNEIVDAARQMMESRFQQAQQIEQEARSESI